MRILMSLKYKIILCKFKINKLLTNHVTNFIYLTFLFPNKFFFKIHFFINKINFFNYLLFKTIITS